MKYVIISVGVPPAKLVKYKGAFDAATNIIGSVVDNKQAPLLA